MTEVKLPKYRVIHTENRDEFEMKLNTLADEGYILASFNPVHEPTNMDETAFYAVVKIDEGNYENVIALKDVAPELVTDALSAGWEITSTSLSTKFVRMIRRKKI